MLLGKDAAIVIGIEKKCTAKLTKIGFACGIARCLPGSANRYENECRQDADNGDDSEQFDQGERTVGDNQSLR